MTSLKSALRHITPGSLWEPMSSFYWHRYDPRRNRLAARFSGRYKRGQARIDGLYNAHTGGRCFIIGNGPSLRGMDLSLLENEITFGQNRIYLLFSDLGFETTYYVAVNSLLIDQSSSEISRLRMPKFISWRSRRCFAPDEDVLYINSEFSGSPHFSTTLQGPVYEGSTVTFATMQIAFHMGFDEVVLIGVDHRYSTRGRPNTTVVSDGIDRDHFSSTYFPKGFRWQLPDLEASRQAYQLAQQAFQRHQRNVMDATIDGNLNVFPKVSYESLF